jgi:hypothetical protein
MQRGNAMGLLNLKDLIVARFSGTKYQMVVVDGEQYIVADALQVVLRNDGKSTAKFYVRGRVIAEIDIDWNTWDGTMNSPNPAEFWISFPNTKSLLRVTHD